MMLFGVVALTQVAVSFSAPAMAAGKLLPQLGQTVGIKMEAGSTLEREVLLVQVKNVALDDLMKRLAHATSGEWEKSGEVYRLRLDTALNARERRAEAETMGQQFLDQIARRRKSRGDLGSSGIIEAVLASLSAETLGDLGYRERAVFSTRPTAMQRRLPTNAFQAVGLSKLQNRGVPLIDSTASPAGPITLAQLVLQLNPDGRNLSAALLLADARNQISGGERTQLSEGYPSPRPKVSPPPEPDAQIDLPIPVQSFADILKRFDMSRGSFGSVMDDGGSLAPMYSEADLSEPRSSVPPAILQPETQEPLGWVAGPLIAQMAASQKTNLVADIPDSAFAAMNVRRGLKAVDFVDEAWRSMDTDIAVADGWTVVRPRRPARARKFRLDRDALGTALRALAKDHSLSLDAQAAYAKAQPLLPDRETFESTLFTAVDRGFGQRIAASSGSGERQLLRLYGALGGNLAIGNRTVGSLPTPARTALADLVFNSVASPQISVLGGRSESSYPSSRRGSLDFERTVCWARGIPLSAEFSLGERYESAFFGRALNGLRPQIANGATRSTFRPDGRGNLFVETNAPLLPEYVSGTIRTLTFGLWSEPGLLFSRNLQSSSISQNSPPVAFAALPEDVRRSIEFGQASVRKALDDYRRRSAPAQP